MPEDIVDDQQNDEDLGEEASRIESEKFDKAAEITSQNTRRNLLSSSSRHQNLMKIGGDFEDLDEYTLGYYQSKKKFKLLLKNTEDMRLE